MAQRLVHTSLGNAAGDPHRELPTAIQLVDALGSERLMWDPDMPNVERFCSERHTLETFTDHCRGLIVAGDITNIRGRHRCEALGVGCDEPPDPMMS